METFQVQCMIDEVARAKHDLMALTLDDSVTPDRFAKCEVAASDLESAVTELLTTAWVPKNLHELAACIVCVHENLKHVQSDVAAALDVVLLECKPDELYRVFLEKQRQANAVRLTIGLSCGITAVPLAGPLRKHRKKSR